MRSWPLLVLATLILIAIGAGVLWFATGRGHSAPTGQAPLGEVEAPESPRQGTPPHTSATRKVALRIRARAADWTSALPGAELKVYRHDPRTLELPRDPITVQAGADGIAELGELVAGPYLICAPGIGPSGEPPGIARVDVDPDRATSEVVVVAAPPLIDFDIEVLARFAPRFGVSTRLVLVRTDDASRRVFAFPRVVEPGQQTLRMQLPRGTYEVGSRPLGELVVRSDERMVRVSADARSAAIHLDENPTRIQVTLRGISDDELPARVVPVEDGRVQDDRPQTSWWGAFRWPSATAVVPALENPQRLTVFGRTKVFLADRAQRFDGGSVEVTLQPATRLLVDCGRWDAIRDAGATISIDTDGQSFLRMLLPTFGSERPELAAPSFAGELVIPRGGTGRIDCLRADGSTAWTRTVVLDTDTVRLHLDSMDH